MTKVNPDYTNLGLSTPMGPQLRKLVEDQLIADLKHYGVDQLGLKFDWSNSCMEGHYATFLDGSLENYSGINVYDETNNIIVIEGWMEFILMGDFFLVYWDNITIWKREQLLNTKEDFGIPDHVWQKIPEDVKAKCEADRIKQPPFQDPG